MYLLMNAIKHGMKKIKKETGSMLHDYSLFSSFLTEVRFPISRFTLYWICMWRELIVC